MGCYEAGRLTGAAQQNSCTVLSPQDIDYLASFPELDEYTVSAADGHFIDHACHTEKGNDGKVYAAGFIYRLNLRNGLLRPFCLVTNGTPTAPGNSGAT